MYILFSIRALSRTLPTKLHSWTKVYKLIGKFSDKVKRLEALLTKCKESIKANKQKTNALTEVKESLATHLAVKEEECKSLSTQVTKIQTDFEILKKKEQEEELQVCLWNWIILIFMTPGLGISQLSSLGMK